MRRAPNDQPRKITIIPPDITPEENERRYREYMGLCNQIALNILVRREVAVVSPLFPLTSAVAR